MEKLKVRSHYSTHCCKVRSVYINSKCLVKTRKSGFFYFHKLSTKWHQTLKSASHRVRPPGAAKWRHRPMSNSIFFSCWDRSLEHSFAPTESSRLRRRFSAEITKWLPRAAKTMSVVPVGEAQVPVPPARCVTTTLLISTATVSSKRLFTNRLIVITVEIYCGGSWGRDTSVKVSYSFLFNSLFFYSRSSSSWITKLHDKIEMKVKCFDIFFY